MGLFRPSVNSEDTYRIVTLYPHVATEANDIKKQKILRRGGKNTQKNDTKKIFMTQITMMVCSLTQSQTSWSMKTSGP